MEKTDLELITAYVQVVVHALLKNSATELSPKNIREEVKMFYDRFGDNEVKLFANVIERAKRQKNK